MNGNAQATAKDRGTGVIFIETASEKIEQMRKSAASIKESIGRVHNFLGNVGVKVGNIENPGGEIKRDAAKPESVLDVLDQAMSEVNMVAVAALALATRCS